MSSSSNIGTALGTAAAIAGVVLLFVPGLNVIVAGILAAIVIANVAYQALGGGLRRSRPERCRQARRS